MGQYSWSWDSGTASERAEMVRNHAYGRRPMESKALASLFHLSEEGVAKILRGDVWRPEYEQTPGA